MNIRIAIWSLICFHGRMFEFLHSNPDSHHLYDFPLRLCPCFLPFRDLKSHDFSHRLAHVFKFFFTFLRAPISFNHCLPTSQIIPQSRQQGLVKSFKQPNSQIDCEIAHNYPKIPPSKSVEDYAVWLFT